MTMTSMANPNAEDGHFFFAISAPANDMMITRAEKKQNGEKYQHKMTQRGVHKRGVCPLGGRCTAGATFLNIYARAMHFVFAAISSRIVCQRLRSAHELQRDRCVCSTASVLYA